MSRYRCHQCIMVTRVRGVYIDQERKKSGSRTPKNSMGWGGAEGGGEKMSKMGWLRPSWVFWGSRSALLSDKRQSHSTSESEDHLRVSNSSLHFIGGELVWEMGSTTAKVTIAEHWAFRHFQGTHCSMPLAIRADLHHTKLHHFFLCLSNHLDQNAFGSWAMWNSFLCS